MATTLISWLGGPATEAMVKEFAKAFGITLTVSATKIAKTANSYIDAKKISDEQHKKVTQ